MKPTRMHKRGDIKSGLLFWGMSREKERWVTPQRCEELRQIKNAWSRKWKKTPQGRAKSNAASRKRGQLPHVKAYRAEFQRKKRHIYGPRQREWRREYKKLRRASDPFFRLKENLANTIRIAMKRRNTRKSEHTNESLGCTYEFFRGWIESQFTRDMTWDNYGSFWHVDHIVAINLFDLSVRENRAMAFNFKNCRPLFGPDNASKNDKLDLALVEQYELQKWLNYIKPEFLQSNIIPFQQSSITRKENSL